MQKQWIDEKGIILKSEDLEIELRQAQEEGRDLTGIEG